MGVETETLDDATNAALVDITKDGGDELVRRLSEDGFAIVNLNEWVNPNIPKMDLENAYKSFISIVTGRPYESIETYRLPKEMALEWHTDVPNVGIPLIFICYKLQPKQGSANMLVRGQDLYNELQAYPALFEKLQSGVISPLILRPAEPLFYDYNGRVAVQMNPITMDEPRNKYLGLWEEVVELKKIFEGLTIEVKPPEGYMLVFDNLSMVHGVRAMGGEMGGGSNPNRVIYRHFASIPTVKPYSQITFGFSPTPTTNGG